jgi:hypothetical protein
MNFSDTGQSFASIDQAAVDNRNNAFKESQTFTKCVNKQKDNVTKHASVLWHLEGTRQLINESVNVVTKPHDFGCENTCPNLQSATKGGNSAQGTIKSTQSRGLDYSNILGEKVNELSDKLPTSVTKVYSSNEQNSVADYPPQTLLTKHIRSGSRPESLDSVFSNNPATKLRSSPRSLKKMSSSAYKNTHMQNNVSLGEYKEVSVDPIMSQTSFPDKSVPNKNDAQLDNVVVNEKTVINGVKNNSAVKLRSSPRSVKNTSTAAAHKIVHMSDKTSMVEYYGLSLNAELKGGVNDESVLETDNHFSDADSDIVELPMLGSVM